MGEPKIVIFDEAAGSNDIQLKDGDGGGGNGSEIMGITMSLVSNGVILSYIYCDGTELTEVYNDMKTAIKSIEMSVPCS